MEKKMSNVLRVLGIPGSLRKNSYNKAALRAAQELVPEGMMLEIYDLSSLPLYNIDLESGGYPKPVQEFRESIAASDALLIATPEYNFSIPGVLKNAFDWASRNPNSPLQQKPVAVMGASTGLTGTARAQMHLQQVFLYNNMFMLNKPHVYISRAVEKFDANGKLIDETTRNIIRDQLVALAAWTRRLTTPA
jgi:chromate reductase, NAD(P)H dehydrogenase (quinone)